MGAVVRWGLKVGREEQTAIKRIKIFSDTKKKKKVKTTKVNWVARSLIRLCVKRKK